MGTWLGMGLGRALEAIGAVLSAGAGVYLLTKNSVPIDVGGQAGESWLEVLAHGIGAYFVARGAWMFGQIGLQRASSDALERLVELGGGHDDANAAALAEKE